jgi:serralysin
MNDDGTVKSRQKIAGGLGGGPTLADGDRFGRSVASLGDLDGDGVIDLAVGAFLDDTGGDGRGAVHVLFLNTDGTVKQSRKIASNTNGGPTLANGDRFGSALTAIGDLDGDGVTDLAVGADYDDAGGSDRGAAHVLFLNADGTVKTSQKIASGIGGGPVLANGDNFGGSTASLGDLDGDGVSDLVVGAVGDDTGGAARGAVHVLMMNSDGTVKTSLKIASGTNGGPTLANGDAFGSSVASLGDVDADGLTDLAVGAIGDDTGGSDRGAVHVLLLNANGSVKSFQEIAHATGGGPTLENVDRFGRSLAPLGDLDGDGVTDLAVGASADNTGGTDRGAVHVLFLKKLNRSPVITSANTANASENSTSVMTVTATDPDLPPQPITFSIVGGADQARFSITGGGLLSFSSAPDFEAPTDANGDNVYIVTVQASDGEGGIATQTISVTVTPINDNNPVFTSPDAASVAENTTTVMTVTATDADLPAQSLTYSIVGGADQAKFSITSGGVLSFNSAPNFEAPTDSNGDNVYVAIVQASDGSLTNLQVILVSVTGVNDNNPVITSPTAANVPENTTNVMTVTATDADLPAQSLTFSIVGGVDQSKFSITSGGALSFSAAPDFEAPTDANGDNVYIVIVQASDGTFTGVQAILVTVTPVNDNNPVIVSEDTIGRAENTTFVVNVTAVDADRPTQALTYSIVGGADQARFGITPGGVLSFNSPPDYEAPTDANGDNLYFVTVRASDGTLSGDQIVSVNVLPVNDNNPVFTSPDSTSVAENTTAVMTVTSTDADLPAQPLTYSIVGGADQTKFGITSGGILTFNSAPDFETPTDANGDNIYVVIVQVSDGSLTSLHAILVTVTNVGEPPALLGDYNVNSVVDAADYVFWRKMLGTGVALAYDGADGDGDTTIDEGDYSVWTTRFGQTLPGSALSNSIASLDKPNVSIARTAVAEPTQSAQVSNDENQLDTTAAANRSSAPEFSHRAFDRRISNARATRLTLPAVDSHWDRGLLSWLSELDRDIPVRRDWMMVPALTGATEDAFADADSMQTVDEVFSSVSTPW